MAGGSTAKGSSTRARILTEARRALIVEGLDGLVMREVAAACGIKLGNLQYYFPTREALLTEVIRSEARLDVDVIRARSEALEPAVALRALVAELNRRWRGDGAVVFATLTTLALHRPEFRTLRNEIYGDFYAVLEPVLAAIDPDARRPEIALRARLITALIDGSPLQVDVGSAPRFLKRLQDVAARIAGAVGEGRE